ncbi:MAG: isochorismate synthase [Chloroflexota bacterium]|nr:isochorismate synthase [Dehalococcoidia bacterium]MDW8254029.1 isochorismate synthase [Chloroflexota bacterium]
MTIAAREAAASLRPPRLRVTVSRLAGADPLALFAERGQEDAFFWAHPATGRAFAGVGAAAVFRAAGPDRLERADAWWRALVEASEVDAPADAPAAPLCVGGVAFDPHRPLAPHWDPFGSAWFFIPAVAVVVEFGSAWRVDCGSVASPLRALDGEAADLRLAPAAPAAFCLSDGALSFRRAVEQVVAEIARGAFEKLVLAREVIYRNAAPFPVLSALDRLRAAYPGCATFAVARGERVFLGATPERLVRLTGSTLQTMCLAGSAPRGATAETDARLALSLLGDPKERREHHFVVAAMREALTPLCSRLDIPAQPTVVSLPNLHHLKTSVTGQLRGEETIFAVVDRLHPTPAVGAAPPSAAFPAIRRHEPFDRGWFAAPLGWLTPTDGEFVVALRSALVTGEEARLYAGCGIVAGSDPERELQETELKLQPMREALQVSGP